MAKSKGGSTAEKKPTQADMIRAAMAELGDDAKPLAMQAFVQSKYGKTIPATTISNYKSVMKKKAAQGGGRKRGDGIKIDDIETVTGLVRRLGAAQVKRLIEVIG
jgi:hypothetical protein